MDINLFITQFEIRFFFYIFAGIVTNRRSQEIYKVLIELIEHAPICKIQSYIKGPARFPRRSMIKTETQNKKNIREDTQEMPQSRRTAKAG